MTIFEENLKQYDMQWEIVDIIEPFLKKLGFTTYSFIDRSVTLRDPEFYTKDYNEHIKISKYWFGGVSCYQIRITNGTSSGLKNILKPGNFQRFDGVNDLETIDLLENTVNDIQDKLNPVKMIIGSGGKYTIDLDILIFFEEPNLKEYKKLNIYGSNFGIELKNGISLFTNSRHDNIIDVFDNGVLKGMYAIHGYGDCKYFYNGGSDIKVESDSINDIDKWIVGEWSKICEKKKIKTGTKYNSNRYSVADFMRYLNK